MSDTRLLSTDELLRGIVDEITEIRVREHSVMQNRGLGSAWCRG
ncbi:hypothetical protein [Lentzea roselyniae]